MRFGARILKHIRPSIGYALTGVGATCMGYSALYFNILPIAVFPTQVQTSKPFAVFSASTPELIKFVRVVPYGVLGTQMTAEGKFVQSGTEPETIDVVIVDPAGLHHIQGLPAGAGGAAGAIYKWLGIDLNQPFDDRIRQKISAPTHACRYVYADGTKSVIHAVGPDLRTYSDIWEVKRALTSTYVNIFKEFAEHIRPELDIFRPNDLNINNAEPWGTLRVLPVSGGIFSGDFKDQMPGLTVECIAAALGQLPKIYRRSLAMRTKSIELCIFDEKEIPSFDKVLHLKKEDLANSGCTALDATTSNVPALPQIQNMLDQDDADVPGYIPPKSNNA
eukprot:TRINITY_DN16599_c0_g1_i1.p1 TRINITY_DN16599_c0_g1~~TRINITY_DN16599_c0_g1_i1.p1  ORF type:complete len:357 (+),score=51.54 TRINITY_DN16599_c0_g1_i1:71-1072(+)